MKRARVAPLTALSLLAGCIAPPPDNRPIPEACIDAVRLRYVPKGVAMLGYPTAEPQPSPAGIEPELAGLSWYRVEIKLIEGTRPFGASGPFGAKYFPNLS